VLLAVKPNVRFNIFHSFSLRTFYFFADKKNFAAFRFSQVHDILLFSCNKFKNKMKGRIIFVMMFAFYLSEKSSHQRLRHEFAFSVLCF
jgi:hypothetical protein